MCDFEHCGTTVAPRFFDLTQKLLLGARAIVAGRHSYVLSVRLPRSGRRRCFSLSTGALGVLTVRGIRPKLADRMPSKTSSIAASCDAAGFLRRLRLRPTAANRSKPCQTTSPDSVWAPR